MGYRILYLTDVVDDYESELALDPEDRDEEIIEAIEDFMAELGASDLDGFADIARDDPGLISDYGFEEYAEDFADDLGAIDSNAGWPLYHIDWKAAARDLKMDMMSVEYGGETWWMSYG